MKAIGTLLLLLSFSSCSTIADYTNRGPASLAGVTHIQKVGESCEVDLDGDNQPEKIEISKAFGSRVLIILKTAGAGTEAKYFTEALTDSQTVDCIANSEPGFKFAGTDETERAISISMKADYLKVKTPEKGSRFVYFDSPSSSYKHIWRAD
jgi:hypothetical protein